MRLPLLLAGAILSTASQAQPDALPVPGTALVFRYECLAERQCSVICWSNVGKIEYQDVSSAQLIEYFSRPQQSMPEYLLAVTAKGSDIAQNTHIQGAAACSFTQMRLVGAEGPRTPAERPRALPRPRAPQPPAAPPAAPEAPAPPPR